MMGHFISQSLEIQVQLLHRLSHFFGEQTWLTCIYVELLFWFNVMLTSMDIIEYQNPLVASGVLTITIFVMVYFYVLGQA